MHFKIDDELRAAFQDACDDQDLTPSQALRRLVRRFTQDSQLAGELSRPWEHGRGEGVSSS